MQETPAPPVVPCPRCGDTTHQQYLQTIELDGLKYEVWGCNNPAGHATTTADGCGSHTHRKDHVR